MPRTSRLTEKRRELLPLVARAFAELGYRRTTTAELARRCGVQETILYRLWPDKKAMFIAAIGFVYDQSIAIWRRLLVPDRDGRPAAGTPAERLLAFESEHHGEFGHYRIIFAGLSETDDPDVHFALADMYKRYQHFVQEQIAAHRAVRPDGETLDPALAAWGVVGLGTVANIARELGLLTAAERRRLFAGLGQLLLGGSGNASERAGKHPERTAPRRTRE